MNKALSRDRDCNLFLTEFEGWKWLLKRLSSTWGIVRICGYLFLWALAALILGAYSGANCITLIMAHGQKSAPLLFGYAAELNHGLFNLIGLPIFVYLVYSTLEAADAAFQQIKSAERLTLKGSSQKASAWIREKNRKFFRLWIWVSLALALAAVVPAEILSYNKKTFGWVQSKFAPAWNQATLGSLGMAEVPYAVADSLELTNKMSSAAEIQSVKITKVVGGSQSPQQRRVFPFFLSVSLGLQCLFFTIGFWVIGKLVFILSLLFQGFRNTDDDARDGVRLELHFRDKAKRFGLRALDALYNQGLAMVAVGSFAFTLQQLSNTGKGTTFGVFEKSPFYGHLITIVLAAGVFATILLFPGLLFMRHANAAKNRECIRLEGKLTELRLKLAKEAQGSANHEALAKQIDSLEEDLNLTHEQTPWPADDWLFRVLIILIFAFLILIPLGLLEAVGDWAKPVVDLFAKRLPPALCKLESAFEKILPGL